MNVFLRITITHYYCQEGPVTCGKMIPDELVAKAIAESGLGGRKLR